MTPSQASETAVKYWLRMAEESLASAKSELDAGRLHFTVNRVYYACFYSASAVLLNRGLEFKRHSGVRDALHQHLVKTGDLSDEWGKFYSRLFQNRQEGDYRELTQFDTEEVAHLVERTQSFLERMKAFVPKRLQPD